MTIVTRCLQQLAHEVPLASNWPHWRDRIPAKCRALLLPSTTSETRGRFHCCDDEAARPRSHPATPLQVRRTRGADRSTDPIVRRFRPGRHRQTTALNLHTRHHAGLNRPTHLKICQSAVPFLPLTHPLAGGEISGAGLWRTLDSPARTTVSTTIAKWRHGFKSRWGCHAIRSARPSMGQTDSTPSEPLEFPDVIADPLANCPRNRGGDHRTGIHRLQ